ncbi:aspartate aminotransferase family protein [Saliphagus sp. GCM10025308]
MTNTDSMFYKWGGGIDPDHPRIVDAEDEYLTTESGDRIIDAAAGAAVANLGHNIEGLPDVLAEQAESVDYVSMSYFSHETTERLADQLVDRTPGDLSAAFFTGSGSEAVESAIKLAREYHRNTGNPDKHVVISRWQSYHGATLGALSAGGNTTRRTPYRPLLQDWPKITPAYPYRWEYEGTPEEQARAAARELERTIVQEGEEHVSAFIAEPVSGASIPAARPHPTYYEEVRRICDEYDVLFVADEVMTGFGRTGPMFACEHYDVVPDILVVGKGLSAGTAAISASVVREHVASVFDAAADGSFDHGHTYSGHPISAAAALYVLEQYTDDVLEAGRANGRRLEAALAPLADHPMVGDFRRCGLMLGLEFVADRKTKRPFDPDRKVAKRVFREALADGVYTYPGTGSVNGVAGDHCMLAPPLPTSDEAIDRIASVVDDAVRTVYDDLS